MQAQDKIYIEHFEDEVKKTIRSYHLLKKSDRIIAACSGGKDSLAVLCILKKSGYNVSALILDLDIGKWSEKNLKNTRTFCKDYGIKLHEIKIKDEIGCPIEHVMSVAKGKTHYENCTICGIIKRWILNKKSKALGADKLVTGHNLDDEAQTLFMNILKGNPYLSAGLGPKTGTSVHAGFAQRVKPLYFARDTDIKKYTQIMKFHVLYDRCPLSGAVFRRDIKNTLDNLESHYPDVKRNIVMNYLKQKPMLVKACTRNNSASSLKSCSICGEPARNNICKACEILNMVRSK